VNSSLLIVNSRSGGTSPGTDELCAEARRRGVDVHVLAEGEDPGSVAEAADAEVLGMAGGDGSLAPVASVAAARGIPFVCVPFGTRNHFARDAGLDRDDPIAALDAFADGVERRVDICRAGDRPFLNNVSLGLYALLVHRRERRRRRRDALARLRALLLTLRDRGRTERFVIDGRPVKATLVLIANNDYSLELFSVGERERLDEGRLRLYVPHGLRRVTWEERSCTELEIDAAGHRVRAAVDGEPAELDTPLRFTIEPGALRLLVPRTPEGEDVDERLEGELAGRR
jgi:diacylglycerol kinase family enzyme